MAHFLEDDVAAELPWEPEARYEALALEIALDQENDGSHAASFAMAAATTRAVTTAAKSASTRAIWALDAPAEPQLTSSLAYTAAEAVARDATRGSDATASEYTYDPIMRYNALVHTFRQPRGAKSLDEIRTLRLVRPASHFLFCHRINATGPRRQSAHAPLAHAPPVSRNASGACRVPLAVQSGLRLPHAPQGAPEPRRVAI